MMRRFLIALLVVLVLLPAAFAATQVSSTLQISGSKPVVVTLQGTTAVTEGVDTAGNAHKRAVEVSCVVSGQAVSILVRVEESSRGRFIDLLVSDTHANLSTALDSMDLSTIVPSHPTPAKDAVDSSALAN